MLETEFDLAARLERVLFSQAHIRRRVGEMGRAITDDYEGRSLTIVAVLQGGALFMADLIREISLPLRIDSISVSSYRGGTASSGSVEFEGGRFPEIRGRHVLVIDDILDSGRTLAAVMRRLEEEGGPSSLRSAVLLSKRVERAVPFEPDYAGFEIGDEFVVGYGLDYRGEYRNLPVIGVLREEFLAQGG